ncbi:MAG TPA: dATP/dGTP diphosphohydrolase domain-containing protein, partial [Streptosporangiaceae bacterium]
MTVTLENKDQVTKQDKGKPDWTLIIGPLRRALEAMIRVREFGNEKYSAIAKAAGVPFDPESWRKNTSRRYLASAQRHLAAAIAGERVNHEDGGCNHLAQAAIDLCFAFEVEDQAETAQPTQDAPEGRPEAKTAIAASAERLSMPGESFAVGPKMGMVPPNQGKWFLWTDDGQHVLLDPINADQLPSLELMADVLSRKRRWADHFDGAISVARHCLLVASLVPDEHRLAALLHDASECLYGDRPTPLKHLERTMIAGEHPNDVLVQRFDRLLESEYDLAPGALDHDVIKRADRVVNCWEAG